MSADKTLGQLRDYVKSRRMEGVFCPCCDKYVKAYRRNLNPTMAASLVWLVKFTSANDLEYAHIPTEAPRSVVRSNQISTLKHWGLVEPVPGVEGGWAPTDAGVEFALGFRSVPSRVIVADDVVIDAEAGEPVDIETALGEKYDYETLITANYLKQA